MAHYAFLDENNIVTEVIVGIDETELIEGLSPEEWYGNFRGQRCVRTSYNGNIRKNYAGIGHTYDEQRDAFISPKPYPSWVLDEDTCQWEAPITYPSDVPEGTWYIWNEESLFWEEVTNDN
jgi:hypothetical protein